MKIIAGYECIKCFVSQIDKVISIAGKKLDENEKIKIFKKTLENLINLEFKITPPEIAEKIYGKLNFLLHTKDPFKEIKEKTNKLAEEIVKKFLLTSISLEDAVKYAVSGNVIDFGIGDKKFTLTHIEEVNLERFDFYVFCNKLKKAKNLLYIVDNSGEIIFDKVLISVLKRKYPDLSITIAGRDAPIINDITYEELLKLNFSNFGKVISTGFKGPGVPLNKVSSEFKDFFFKSDLIISKGQGNFETLYGERKDNIFFALKIKCNHVSKAVNIRVGSNIFACFSN